MQKVFRMSAERAMLLLSCSRVHGSAYFVYAKETITEFFDKKNVQTILFIPYAMPDHDAYTTTVSNAFTPWGYNVEGIHTKPNPVEAVSSAQAIFVGGGNTFVLLKTLYDLKLVEVIREQVLKKGIPYMGSSAGTNVATRSINTTNDMPIVWPPTFQALNLVACHINTHYLDPDPNLIHMGETRDERLKEFVLYHKRSVLGLREGGVLLVEDKKITLLGTKKAKLFRPELEPIEYKPNSDLSFLINDA